MTYQLGIDLGTTYTAAAVCRSSDRRWAEPEVVSLGHRSATVPSVLFIAEDGGVVVGEAAERRAVTDFDRVVREFKRRIGDPTPVMVAGRPWAPQDLSAQLVRWVVDRVAEREGGPAERIAVTHPASWGQHKKDLLANALAGQGLAVTFLAEPQAAALSYAANERTSNGSTIAVYDLGGGTFDAACVRKGEPAGAGSAAGFGLLGRPEGLERLGGIDFDEAVFGHVIEGMPDAFADLDDTDSEVLAAVARLRRDCTEAKEALSADTEVAIPVMLPNARGSVRLHRSEFEAMIRPQVEETVSALRAAVISAGLTPDQLTAVLLVGGSSRIPLVGQLVSEQLGRPVAVDADPKNAIAKGAALSVSPKPTVSWPGVSMAPVPGGAPGGPGGPGGPPARPPMPGMGGPGPQTGQWGPGPGGPGGPRDPYGEPAAARHGSPFGSEPPSRPGMPPPPQGFDPEPQRAGAYADDDREFNTAEFEQPRRAVAQAPRRPAREPEPYDDDGYYDEDYDDAPRSRRRRGPNMAAIVAGALVAVAIVAFAVIYFPTMTGSVAPGASTSTSESSEEGGSSGGGDAGGGGGDEAPAPPGGEEQPAESSAAEPTDEEETPPSDEATEDPDEGAGKTSTKPSGGGGGSSKTTGNAAGAPTEVDEVPADELEPPV